jgi:high-affinity iron transporter
MIATFVLFLREGLEASLIISILFAALRQLDQTGKARAVWLGVGLAVLGSFLGGLALYVFVHEYPDTTFQTIFETMTYLVAVLLLTTMTFWVQRHSRSLKKELIARATSAGSGFALGLLAFTTVGREGLESAFFTLAFAFQTNAVLLLAGALLGILSAVGLCVLIYRLGYHLDYRLFFRVMGILLLFFAAGLLSNAVQNMQELGWLTIGTAPLWNTAHILSEESVIGDLLHGVIGYAQAPTILQGLFYMTYLLVVGGVFAWMTRKPNMGRPAMTSSTEPAKEHVHRA